MQHYDVIFLIIVVDGVGDERVECVSKDLGRGDVEYIQFI